jgi:hypothetical protein
MRSNCVLFALCLYLRRRKRGLEGYLLIRKSRLGWYCHVLYAEVRPGGRLRIVSFKPNDARPLFCPPPLFRGHGAWGDN